MKIQCSVTENNSGQPVARILLSMIVAMVLHGMSLSVAAADLDIRIYEREGKLPLQDVSVCLGTPANISQFGAALTGLDGQVTFGSVPGAPLVVTASKSGYRTEQQSLITNNRDRLLVLSLPSGGGGPVCETGGIPVYTGSASMRVSQFRINKGVAVTTNPDVLLNHQAEGAPTHYRASEHPDFTRADWQAYTAKPAFELSPGYGRKVVYFQVRRFTNVNGANLEVLSPVVQDAITLQRR